MSSSPSVPVINVENNGVALVIEFIGISVANAREKSGEGKRGNIDLSSRKVIFALHIVNCIFHITVQFASVGGKTVIQQG